jgi:hypothetical protein
MVCIPSLMKILCVLLLVSLFPAGAFSADSPVPAAALTQPVPPAVRADPAAVEAMLAAVHFDETMDQALSRQKQIYLGKTRQMMANLSLPGMPPAEMQAASQKILDAAWAKLNLKEVHAIAARNYGAMFTPQELRAIADFYNTPAGQAYLEKQPETQQNIVAAIRPHLTQVMHAIQIMVYDYTTEQRAKARRAAAEASAKAVSQPVAPAPTVPPKS